MNTNKEKELIKKIYELVKELNEEQEKHKEKEQKEEYVLNLLHSFKKGLEIYDLLTLNSYLRTEENRKQIGQKLYDL
ncbi:hypothetical protein [Capnocytophaga catalasegens]|uniref:Uncharacterized protein n=1 Tax=Capnocytophaga catalasegens TaxID=1004260 RepID=A0AAV5AVP3_9FLAO|nr:hypothetical protein [Capnocytophaga catalasegens]GIZ15051.1 hypothetical protein RCZ03_10510 [Capnocytophaga catalasegens]GJM49431.1 hypothetical protein RCZ15_04060 [Capnocytophaga catalasegens]GJM52581.1 hypothetical protein RCZ16_08980 [Capnocytophaga catalasegens]